jgi:hypothetical protein
MKACLRVLCACGLFALGGRGLWAQSSPNANGPITGRLETSNVPDGPRSGLIYGEPYSAVTETDNTRTLTDGTHIEQKRAPEEKTFRDSQGRTRREQYNPTNLAGDAPTTLGNILINDPVAGVEYYLSPQTHVACQGSPSWVGFTNQGGTGKCTFSSASSAQVQPTISRVTAPSAISPSQRPRNKVVVEDLGTQEMEGLTVHGTRTTMTIPTGAQGNDRPIETVREMWFSKDLNIYVLIKGSDPRSGESTIRTTNIDRSEPDPSLFRVPPDYTISQQ